MNSKFLFFLFLIVLLTFPSGLFAQQNDEKSAAELAKELANPNATLGQMLFPIDYTLYNGDIPDATQNGLILSFQPSLPISLSEGLNLYVRPLIPVYLSQPVTGKTGFEKRTALGNISADVAIGKTWPSKTITLIGIFGGFPTATYDAMKTGQTTLGPEFMVAQLTNFGAVGILVSQAWGVGTPDDTNASSISITAGQYFYTVNLTKGWQISASPTYAYNHNGTEGNKFTFPLGTGAQKVFKLGKLPIKAGVQYWYYIASPDAFGPQHQFRFTIAPVVPLPW